MTHEDIPDQAVTAAPGVPAKAILDAAEAIKDAIEYWDGWIDAAGLAREAVKAAAPHITAAGKSQRIISAIFACRSEDCPKPFALHRAQAVTAAAYGSLDFSWKRPQGAVTAMCECGHHWHVHSQSGQTAPNAICHGYHGSATPGPYKPCDCRGFAQWSGPRDARTGEPVKPLTLSTASDRS